MTLFVSKLCAYLNVAAFAGSTFAKLEVLAACYAWYEYRRGISQLQKESMLATSRHCYRSFPRIYSTRMRTGGSALFFLSTDSNRNPRLNRKRAIDARSRFIMPLLLLRNVTVTQGAPRHQPNCHCSRVNRGRCVWLDNRDAVRHHGGFED